MDGRHNYLLYPEDIIQKDQVIAVNCENPEAGSDILVGISNKYMYPAAMALRQVMLFDRVLTEDEIRYVSEKMIRERKEVRDGQGDA